MTTSRIVRGTKIRIFVCFCGLVVIFGLIACYNNTLTQLEETRKAIELCQQQQDNLSQQLQVISDYKLRLEKALQTEKADHSKSNATYEQTVKDEKSKSEKGSSEAKIRFNSLQQRYNLLQTELDDYKEKTSKIREEQIEETNKLNEKLKKLEEGIKEISNSKEKLKTEYLNLQIENDNLKRQMEGHDELVMGNENKTNYLQNQNIALRREIENLKEKYSISNDERKERLDENVLILPVPNNESNQLIKSSSSTSSTVKQSSRGSLNGARPLVLPTMTPKNKENRMPEGVLQAPNLNEVEKNEKKIENVDIVDNRYNNQMVEEKEKRRQEELEKENGANEVFEGQNVVEDGIGFVDKQNIINQKQIGNDYKERPIDRLDENAVAAAGGMDEAEDDDQDEYGDHLVRQKEPAVRN